MTHAASLSAARRQRSEYEAGATLEALARKHGMSVPGMRDRISRAGGTIRKKGGRNAGPDSRLEDMECLLNLGHSLAYVGTAHGITRERMRQIARREGWTHRRRG